MSPPNEASAVPRQPRPQRAVSLWPREHGAYVQLLGPLACAASFGPHNMMAAALVAAACAVFLAHEPLLVLLGHRGERARSQCAAAALRRLLALGAVALGAAGWFWAGDPMRALSLCVPLSLSLVAAGTVLSGRERTLWGQLLSASTLASFSVPVLFAAGITLRRALEFALGWTLVHVTATCAARAYVYRRKHGPGALQRATAFAVCALLLSAALYVAGWLPPSFALASAPFVVLALLLSARLLQFKSPKTLGWTMTSVNLIAFVVFGLDLL